MHRYNKSNSKPTSNSSLRPVQSAQGNSLTPSRDLAHSESSRVARARFNPAFTIVELLIVVVVIGILAAISVIAYTGITQNATEASMKSDLKNASTALELAKVQTGNYPVNVSDIPASEGNAFTYAQIGDGYCLSVSSTRIEAEFNIRANDGEMREGPCIVGLVASAISVAGASTCAVSGGKAYCWGWMHGSSDAQLPMEITGTLSGKTVTDVSAGDNHSCAVADGQAYCWGSGFLGNGVYSPSVVASPIAVSTDGDLAGRAVTNISVIGGHTCLIADSQAYCWGSGNSGQLGNGSSYSSSVPVAVSTEGVLSGKAVTAISTHRSHTCAIADSEAYCWGENNMGQLGDGTVITSNVPVAVSKEGALAGKSVEDISVGNWTSCAVADGQAFCWGYGGRLGNGSVGGAQSTPVAVSTAGVLSGKTVTSIDANLNSCVVANSQPYCWGSDYGNTPVAISTDGLLSGRMSTSVSAGDGHACVIASNQTYCWGANHRGQLGNGTTINSSIPAAVSPLL